METRRISIADVARQAGVSITSVSRIINNVDYPVSADVRARVEAAVRDLNYLPNLAAQRLRSNFNNVIGLIVRDIDVAHFAEIAKGATERAMAYEYLCFVCNTGRSAETELKFHELLWKNRVQGIILSGGGLDNDLYREMLVRQHDRSVRYGLRLVACAPQHIDLPMVGIDFRAAAALIAGHVADRGHRRIAFLTGRADVLTSRDHIAGYRDALTARGIPFDPAYVGHGDFTEQAGHELCRAMLELPVRPTAILCGSDPMAIGIIHALHEKGLRVPDDVSLASLGDMPMSTYLQPPLTAVRIPRFEIGVQAVDAIMAPLAGADGRDAGPVRRMLPVALMERQSVRRI